MNEAGDFVMVKVLLLVTLLGILSWFLFALGGEDRVDVPCPPLRDSCSVPAPEPTAAPFGRLPHEENPGVTP